MTPQEILDECKKLGIVLRLNQGTLTATPRKKMGEDLHAQVREQRAAVIELLEQRAAEDGELAILPAGVVESVKLTDAQRLLRDAASIGIEIHLDEPSLRGRIVVDTPRDPATGIPRQIPATIAARLMTYHQQIVSLLRAPYVPPPRQLAPGEKRSIWERMALPDDILPTFEENQQIAKELILGGPSNMQILRQTATLDAELPTVIAPGKI